MDSAYARRLLDILIENAFRILDAGYGIDWTESTFFDIVRLLRDEGSLKDYFLKRVGATLSMPDPGYLIPGMVPTELIEQA